jgi:hypothetical protein
LGKGNGTFEAVREYNTAQTQGHEATIADLNGDGAPDVISSDLHASIGFLLNVTGAKAKLTDVAVPGTSKDGRTWRKLWPTTAGTPDTQAPHRRRSK